MKKRKESCFSSLILIPRKGLKGLNPDQGKQAICVVRAKMVPLIQLGPIIRGPKIKRHSSRMVEMTLPMEEGEIPRGLLLQKGGARERGERERGAKGKQ